MNEPTRAKRPSLFPATFLIFLGLILLLRSFHLLHWNEAWPLILVGIGTALCISALGRSDKGAVFPGTILLLVGAFFFLWNRLYLYESVGMDELWPVFPLIVGIAFLVIFLLNPKDWGVIVPAGILILISALFFFTNFGLLSSSRWTHIGRLWPVVLIMIGVGLLLGRKKTP